MFFLEVEQGCIRGEEGEKWGRKPCEFTPHPTTPLEPMRHPSLREGLGNAKSGKRSRSLGLTLGLVRTFHTPR